MTVFFGAPPISGSVIAMFATASATPLAAAFSGMGLLSCMSLVTWWLRWWILPDEFRGYSLFLTLLFLTLTGHAALQLVWQGLCKMTRKSPSGRGKKTQKAAARKKREKAYA